MSMALACRQHKGLREQVVIVALGNKGSVQAGDGTFRLTFQAYVAPRRPGN